MEHMSSQLYIVNNSYMSTTSCNYGYAPSGKHTQNYGKSPVSMGKSTIFMAIFNGFLYVYQAG